MTIAYRLLNIGIFILSLAGTVRAQQLHLEQPGTIKGLDKGYITHIFQDKKGFVWMGTLNGLKRYDGYEVKTYQPGKSQDWSLKSSRINRIYKDPEGLLWLNTERGPVVMEPYTERFLHLKEVIPDILPSGEIKGLLNDGRFFLIADGAQDIYEISYPSSLKEMIRSGQVEKAGFSVRKAVLRPGIQGPFFSIFIRSDSMIITFDGKRQMCRIHERTLDVSPLNAAEAGAWQEGNYGLLYAAETNRGLIFKLKGSLEFTRPNIDSSSVFFKLPSGQRILFSEFHDVLYQLQLRPGQNESAENSKFRGQFPELIRLDRNMTCYLIDSGGNIWIGTNGYGVRIVRPEKQQFTRHFPQLSFAKFAFLPDGRIWPGIYNSHKSADFQSGNIKEMSLPGGFNDWQNIYSLFVSRNKDIWAATMASKDEMFLSKYTASQGRWIKFPLRLKYTFEVPPVFFEDAKGFIWLAGNRGQIIRISPTNNQVEQWDISHQVPPDCNEQLRSYCMAQGNQDTLWIGNSCGLVQITRAFDMPRFQFLHDDAAGKRLFSNENILSIHVDGKHQHVLWLGTKWGGLDRLDTRNYSVKNYHIKGGLNDNIFYGILPDSLGQLWISSNQGILCFDPDNERFSNFFDADAAIQTEFNTGSYALLPDGKLAFGSIEGLFIIDANKIARTQTSYPAVAITQFSINNDDLDDPMKAQFLSISDKEEYQLKLPHYLNNLYLSFAALPPGNRDIYQYRYRLSTLDADWTELGNLNSMNLAGLATGNHVLELQAVALNADWNAATTTRVFISVSPPWYNSWPAWLCYALLFGGAIYWYVINERKKLELKFNADLNQRESLRLKSLNEFKSRFFAYITHEFKTPLTLIVGLTERMKTGISEEERAGIKKTILAQTRNMLELINQLIDISRTQEKNLELHWQQGNISRQVESVVASVWSLAQFQDVKLSFESAVPNLMMDYDPLRLHYIMSNLITNAIRHSPAGSTVYIQMLQPDVSSLRISVADSGDGIDPEHLPHIFEPYYRAENQNNPGNNFGLGLAFVKDLVGLFRGTIEVNSTPGHGCVFTILLPVTQKAPLQNSNSQELLTLPPQGEEPLLPEPAEQKTLPVVLVVEDNETISMFIQSALISSFRLIIASNGKEGWEKALEHLPDLILTDYIMPGIDGLMLTQKVKANQLTSHIPVVMLSARFDLSDRLSGHQHGVDIYLPKPFHEKELILILQNLIALKQRWQERYANVKIFNKAGDVDPDFPKQEDMAVQQTDLFMRRLYTVFEENLSNEAFSRDDLCKELHVSRSQLQRKMAAISNDSAMELLRQFRLTRASQMLEQDPKMKVQEVCYKVGFKYPDYFTKLFVRKFGVLPTEFKKKSTNEQE
jgi:signal transduction histidine kinase/DNA-binding response OmpR family regulator/ligand-binding sensor domain-containing protein